MSQELLNEHTKRPVKMSFCMKLGQNLMNILVTVIVLACIAGVELGLWCLLTMESSVTRWELIVSLVITLVVAFCPLLFHLLNK